MGLSADLSQKLDVGSVVSGLLSSLTTQAGDLGAVQPPADNDEIGGVAAGASVDTSGIGGAAGRIADGARSLLDNLPPAANALAPITSAITVVEQLAQGDIGGRLEALLSRLATELKGEGQGGFVGALFRVAAVLRDSPETGALVDIIKSMIGLTGAEVGFSTPIGDLIPAVQGTSSAFAGLMSLESVLGEAERLTRVMAVQLDAGEVARRKQAILDRFGSGQTTLAGFLAAVDEENPAEVEAARAALADLGKKLQDLGDYIIRGMAFGEATLAHVGPERVLAEVELAAHAARDADLHSTERLVGRAMGALNEAISVDLSGAPYFTFNQIVTILEGQIAQLAGSIAGFDMAALVSPLTDALSAVTGVIDGIADVVERVTIEVRGALEQVRQVIAALPIGDIVEAIQTALDPVTQAMDAITDFVGDIEDALRTTVETAKDVIQTIETTIDEFKAQIEGIFGEARELVESVNLDQVIGNVTDGIRQFADLISRAQMKPYFDTAVDVIGVTSSVVEAIPFSMLPDSMKSEVDAAVKPIKDADADAFQAQIESILQITPDGKFALRDEIEEGIREVDEQIQALLDTIAEYDPHQYVAQIDAELEGLSAQINELQPALALQPIQDAIQQVKDAITGLDLAAQLEPVNRVFDDIIAAIDRYSPSQLIRPIEDKIDEVRASLVGMIQLDRWLPTIDAGVAKARELLDLLDPGLLAPGLGMVIGQIRELIDGLPDVKASRSLGSLVTMLTGGSGLRIYPWSFDPVMEWVGGASGTAALQGRSERIAVDVIAVHDAVAAVAPGPLLADLSLQAQAVSTAAAALAARVTDPDRRVSIEVAAELVDVGGLMGTLTANHGRYLERLVTARAQVETLRRTGLSEVDETAGRIRQAFAPAAPARAFLREALSHVGLADAELSIRGVLRALLQDVTPERILGLLAPVFMALRNRIQAMVDAIATPVRAGVTRFTELVNAFDLTPLREAVDGIVNEVKEQIMAFSPETLLAEPLAAWDAFRARVETFDPIGLLLDLIDELKAAAQRVLAKLHAGEILASPLAIYDHIMGELRKLRLDGLLSPIFDQLDELAHQVDDGLDRTVTGFKRLQAALPGGGGGSSAEVSVSVGS